jgi:hypothetical protein
MSHALRGPAPVGRGDLTGARILALQSRKTDYDTALANTRTALMSDPTEVIQVTGGRAYLIPMELANFIREGRNQDDDSR